MTKLQLPWLTNSSVEQLDLSMNFKHSSRFPLVVWSSKLSKTKKTQLKLLCGLNEYPFKEINASDPATLDKEMENAWQEIQTPSIIIIGDNQEFPPMKFKTQFGIHYSDLIYADIGNKGMFDVGIGRIFGSMDTITKHLQIKIGDSNEAFLFETDPKRSSSTIEAVKALGFDLSLVGKYDDQHKSKLENAELIMQVSDGLISETIHGSPLEWISSSGTIMNYKHMSGLEFKNYPLIFSESCSTAAFGPLLYNALRAGAMYYGATSPSANNPREFSSWRACAFADGIKIGMLDLMDEVQTIGEVQMGVNKAIYSSLSDTHKNLLERALEKPLEGIEIPDQEVATLLQFNLFGNPERPVVVGIDPDFDSGVIHLDT